MQLYFSSLSLLICKMRNILETHSIGSLWELHEIMNVKGSLQCLAKRQRSILSPNLILVVSPTLLEKASLLHNIANACFNLKIMLSPNIQAKLTLQVDVLSLSCGFSTLQIVLQSWTSWTSSQPCLYFLPFITQCLTTSLPASTLSMQWLSARLPMIPMWLDQRICPYHVRPSQQH